MPASEQIAIAPHLVFDAIAAGTPGAPLVLLLHGFAESMHCWRAQVACLGDMGYRAIAPSQRGYSPGARPDPREFSHYLIDRLMDDAMAIVAAAGYGSVRFHLVGHDWGGLVAWWTASRYPERVAKLAILNAPHPSVAGSYIRRHPSQILKSLYVGFFQVPRLPEAMLSADNHLSLKDALLRTSRPGTFSEQDIAPYEHAWSQPGALTAMLNWYRALPFKPDMNDPGISPPTLVIWGARDRFLEKGLAEASLALCRSGDVVWIDDATHWVQHEEPERVNAALVGFLNI